MDENFTARIENIKKKFTSLNADEKYSYLIELGRNLPPYPDHLRIPEHMVSGCQSTLYFHTEFKDGKLFFSASSDALISQGLAALLIHIYSNTSPHTILASPLPELGLSLSPSRSNGLSSIYMRIKKDSIKYLTSI